MSPNLRAALWMDPRFHRHIVPRRLGRFVLSARIFHMLLCCQNSALKKMHSVKLTRHSVHCLQEPPKRHVAASRSKEKKHNFHECMQHHVLQLFAGIGVFCCSTPWKSACAQKQKCNSFSDLLAEHPDPEGENTQKGTSVGQLNHATQKRFLGQR